MGIIGIHTVLHTSEPEALREMLRDVFGWESVDAHDGWLIFRLPPAELGVHPVEGAPRHELTMMCDDLEATIAELRAKGVDIPGEPQMASFGLTITMVLPGAVPVMLYQPRHVTAI